MLAFTSIGCREKEQTTSAPPKPALVERSENLRALIAAGPGDMSFSKFMGFLAVILASVNIFGGFLVTRRMLQMFKKKGT